MLSACKSSMSSCCSCHCTTLRCTGVYVCVCACACVSVCVKLPLDKINNQLSTFRLEPCWPLCLCEGVAASPVAAPTHYTHSSLCVCLLACVCVVNLCRRHFSLSLSRKSLAALRCLRGSCCVYNFPLASSAKKRITETVDSRLC